MIRNVEAIVLAGGAGSRFGGRKLLSPYKDGVLIDGAVRAALAAPVRKVVLVTGHDAEIVARAACRTIETGEERLTIVHADDYAEGMAASLRAGVRSLSAGTDAALVFLGDMPRTPVGVAGRLIEAIGAAAAAAPSFEGRRGHPVLLAARLFPSLLALTGDRGASTLLRGLGEDLVLVDVGDPGIHFDVDRPSEIDR